MSLFQGDQYQDPEGCAGDQFTNDCAREITSAYTAGATGKVVLTNQATQAVYVKPYKIKRDYFNTAGRKVATISGFYGKSITTAEKTRLIAGGLTFGGLSAGTYDTLALAGYGSLTCKIYYMVDFDFRKWVLVHAGTP